MSGTKTPSPYRENDIPEDTARARLDIVDCRLDKLESLAGSATAWRRFTYIMAGLLVFTVIGSAVGCYRVRLNSMSCVDSVKTVSIGAHGYISDDASCDSALQKGVLTREDDTLVLTCQCR